MLNPPRSGMSSPSHSRIKVLSAVSTLNSKSMPSPFIGSITEPARESRPSSLVISISRGFGLSCASTSAIAGSVPVNVNVFPSNSPRAWILAGPLSLTSSSCNECSAIRCRVPGAISWYSKTSRSMSARVTITGGIWKSCQSSLLGCVSLTRRYSWLMLISLTHNVPESR